jgi:hypothetical protein
MACTNVAIVARPKQPDARLVAIPIDAAKLQQARLISLRDVVNGDRYLLPVLRLRLPSGDERQWRTRPVGDDPVHYG